MPTISWALSDTWLQIWSWLAQPQTWYHPLPFQGESIIPFPDKSPGQGLGQSASGTESWSWSQRGRMPVFAQALRSHPPGCKHRCSACFFPFFSHSAPVARCCLPNSTFLARTVGGQDRRGLGRAAVSGGGLSPLVGSPEGETMTRPALHPRGQLTLQHAPVGRVCDGIDVGRHLVPLLSLVHFNDLL